MTNRGSPLISAGSAESGGRDPSRPSRLDKSCTIYEPLNEIDNPSRKIDNLHENLRPFTAFDISLTCVYWTWANEICSGNAEERAITIAAMIGFFYFFNAGIPNAIFLQIDGPTFCKGFPTTWAFGILAAMVQFLYNREVRLAGTKKAKEVKSGSFSGGEEDADEKREGEVAVIPARPR